MNVKRINELWEVMEHFKRGGVIQVKHRTSDVTWVDEISPQWVNHCDYRKKPDPKLRPWKAEEVPFLAVIRRKDRTKGSMLFEIITGVSELSIYTVSNGSWSFKSALNCGEHSTDGGKTWLPCGVMEEV
jgi:hypothetical protein